MLERYVRGETREALGAEHGVSVEAISWQARNRGYRKMDRPDAVYLWRQAPPITPAADAAGSCGFDYDPDDLDGSIGRAEAQAKRAAAEGRMLDFLRIEQAAGRLRRRKATGGGLAPLHHPSDGPPPPVGEERPPIRLRKAQRAPKGRWATWLFLGGRGAGKTLAGAMWLAEMADRVGAGGRLALIGPTLHDVREVMIEGVSGVLSLPRWGAGARPVFEPSRRRLIFPNGAMAYAFSAEDPDSLRGPQFSAAWADEFCAWRNGGEVLALLRMGLRLPLPAPSPSRGEGRGGGGGRVSEDEAREAASKDGAECVAPSPPERAPPTPTLPPSRGKGVAKGPPLLCVTTTPRPTMALRRLRLEASCRETHAGTADNAAHLSPGFLAGLEALYGGTRRAAQEIEGKVVEAEGALFTAEMLARARSPSPEVGRDVGAKRRQGGERQAGLDGATAPHPSGSGRRPPSPDGEGERKYDRIIVAIDPTTTTGGNACGIIVAGRVGDRAEVLADRSKAGLSPEGWARRTLAAAAEFGARCIVAEVNQGGEMVKAVLKAAGCTLRLREVRATKGKRVRAEPVAALYEQGRVTHLGDFAALEEELMAFGGEDEGAYDLDRADALVWAVTDLLIDRAGDPNRGPRLRMLDAPPVRPGASTLPWWKG